ncbi:hypothetical protein HDU83_005053 [Entophlyctis luteolus]|nr:hypothetical protein HDU83_005053 [Entophlyctis luteolus]
MVLLAKIQGILIWGPEFRIMAYNDLAIPRIGIKARVYDGLAISELLAAPAGIKATIFNAKDEGVSALFEDKAYMLCRYGYIEKTFFTVTTLPILGESGKFEGVVTWSLETTSKVLENSRISYLSSLVTTLIASSTVDEFWDNLQLFFDTKIDDLAFGVIYLNQGHRLTKHSTVQATEFPDIIEVSDDLNRQSISGKILDVFISKQTYELLPAGAHTEHKNGCYVIMPIITKTGETPGLLVIGTSPLLPFNQAYKRFVDFICHEVVSAYTGIQALVSAKTQAENLKELDNTKTSFFMSMSHELRTPLTLMIGPLEDFLKDSSANLSKEQFTSLEMVHRNSKRLLTLVNNLLDIGRLNAGCTSAKFRAVNITQCTRQYIAMFESTIRKKGLQLLVEVEENDLFVFLDEDMWQKIVFNLLGNALKFTLQGHIKCELYKCTSSQKIKFVVSDTGIGIPPDQIGKVFDQFHRVETNRNFQGSGIGLSLVSNLLKVHGGKISVLSNLNEGSSFTVELSVGSDHLPMSQIQKPNEEPDSQMRGVDMTLQPDVSEFADAGDIHSETPPVDEPRGEFLIFIVDDNIDMRTYLRQILSRRWMVRVFENGKSALEAMDTITPSLIVSDIQMPVMTGTELAHAVRSKRQLSRIPIILITGADGKLLGFESGADDTLEKPINSKELILKIKLLLNQYSIRSHLEDDILREKELTAEAMKRIHLDDREKVLEIWKTSFEKKEPLVNLEFRICTPKLDDYFWVQINSISDQDTKGNIISVCSMADVTEKKRLEAATYERFQVEQESQKRRADEAIQSKMESEKFIDMVCHELRNPLNGIQNSNDLLFEMADELSEVAEKSSNLKSDIFLQLEKFRECLEAIRVCAKHQKTIADDVLNLSKLNMNLVKISTSTEFFPIELVTNVLLTFKAEMKVRQTKLTCEVDECFSSIHSRDAFFGDPARITQILINLVTNAAKFTQKVQRRAIKVSISAKAMENDQSMNQISGSIESIEDVKGATNLVLAVSDTGIGMSEVEKSMLFKQFQQASSKTYSEYGGSGLGLFISKRLVDMMEGNVFVDSVKGVGTTFTVVIPLRYKSTTSNQKICPSKHSTNCKVLQIVSSPSLADMRKLSNQSTQATKKILIVDDNDINRMVIQKHLIKIGFESLIALNGLEAYDYFIAHKEEVLLILMDLEMPVMDGLQATKKIRSYEDKIHSLPVPIIGVTGNARKEQADEALASGMTGMIIKPFTREQLLHALSKFTQVHPH